MFITDAQAHIQAASTPQRPWPAEHGATRTWEERAGDSNYRVTWDAAVNMNRALCREVDVPEAIARELEERVAGIEKLPTIAPLISAVCSATRAA